MAQQQLAQRDVVLDAFDGLRVQVVGGLFASVTLARFQFAAASLKPDERIRLTVVSAPKHSLELLKAVLVDLQASKICALHWEYWGEEDVNSVIPLLLNNCPELASLQVNFENYSAFDFVSSVLEHPGNKIKVLVMPRNTEGNIPRFFAALAQSQVSAFTVCGCDSAEFYQGLGDYLAKGLLVRLEVRMSHEQVPLEMMMSLAKCTRLAKLEMFYCKFSQLTAFTHLPKSITKLELNDCTFVGDFDWSFLAGSSVQELGFYGVAGVNGSQFGSALAVRLRAKGLDQLRIDAGSFVDQTLAAAGVEIGRIRRLDIGSLSNAFVELIALALRSPNSTMRELRLPCENETASSIKTHLLLALRHPNCSLAKLTLWANLPWHQAAAKVLEDRFHKRRALFVLLQGQQVRRKVPCLLRRLPVEMLRMVGEVLL